MLTRRFPLNADCFSNRSSKRDYVSLANLCPTFQLDYLKNIPKKEKVYLKTFRSSISMNFYYRTHN